MLLSFKAWTTTSHRQIAMVLALSPNRMCVFQRLAYTYAFACVCTRAVLCTYIQSEALRVHIDSYPIMWWNFSFNNDVIVHILLLCIARIASYPSKIERSLICVLLFQSFGYDYEFSLFIRQYDSRKRESKCVAQVFFHPSIHSHKYIRKSYGNDLRRCLSTTRHMETTTNDKWQALKLGLSDCVCVSSRYITMKIRLKLKQNAVTIVTMHVYVQIRVAMATKQTTLLSFYVFSFGVDARVYNTQHTVYDLPFLSNKRLSRSTMCKCNQITVVVCMRSSLFNTMYTKPHR